MILLSDLKRALGGLLDAPCMLRVAREDEWLFAADFPARQPDRAEQTRKTLEASGWAVCPAGNLWRIDPGPDMWACVIRSVPQEKLPDPLCVPLPLYSLALRLTREPAAAEVQPVLPLRILLKAIGERKADRVLRLFPPLLSEYLREKKPMPSAAGWGLVWAMNRKIFDGEETKC